ncbi:hypothetical protein BKA70DRAFT_233468 [Coprinopsis sp. MPI-PUGE-AT-0042]|nr:hypothetical protein BKA70DRAFT_233468 [Coprinopsis sp. MPI-PUGE-AT-0042]
MKLTSVAALLFPTIALRVGGAAAASGFSKGCDANWTKLLEPLESSSYKVLLDAACGPRKDGSSGETILILDSCIAYRNDTLQAVTGGNLTADGCRGCNLTTGTVMECQCPGGARSIDLDTCVGLTEDRGGGGASPAATGPQLSSYHPRSKGFFPSLSYMHFLRRWLRLRKASIPTRP